MLPVFLIILLTGCTTAGDWLSGSAAKRDSAIAYPKKLSKVQIGVTTKDEVRNLWGNPNDLQISSNNGTTHEAWGYASADPSVHPLQYVLGFGVFAIPRHSADPSFAISFSSEGVVEGMVLREVQPFGEFGVSKRVSEPHSSISPYGSKNPLMHNSR